MILVFGKTGQVARELARIRPSALCLSRRDADLTNPHVCVGLIQKHAPYAVINAAAYTAVDRAETEEALAHAINAVAPGAMAATCAALGIPLVHISTDYAFDGSGIAPFAPSHPPAPLNAYGRSKCAGEEAVRAAGGTYAILRTSWVFSAYGNNFVTTMLRLGSKRNRLRVVADQTGGPTPASAIAEACLSIADGLVADPSRKGTYHLCGRPQTSWAHFARAIMDTAGLACRIEDITTAEYPTPARRPLNSRLDCTGLEVFGLAQPDWRQDLPSVIQNIRGAS